MVLRRFSVLLIATFCMTVQFNCHSSYVDSYAVITNGGQIMEMKNSDYNFNFNFASKINLGLSTSGKLVVVTRI